MPAKLTKISSSIMRKRGILASQALRGNEPQGSEPLSTQKEQPGRAALWRRERDSNPRRLSPRRFSRPLQSTTLPSLLIAGWWVLRCKVTSFFCFHQILDDFFDAHPHFSTLAVVYALLMMFFRLFLLILQNMGSERFSKRSAGCKGGSSVPVYSNQYHGRSHRES